MSNPRVQDGVVTLWVLAGEDVRREPGVLHCDVVHGTLCDQESAAPLKEVGTEPLMGWGHLDGPAIIVRPAHCAWYVSVPARAWDAAVRIALRGTILGHAFEALQVASLHYNTSTGVWTSRSGEIALRGQAASALRDLMGSKARTASLRSATMKLRQRDYAA